VILERRISNAVGMIFAFRHFRPVLASSREGTEKHRLLWCSSYENASGKYDYSENWQKTHGFLSWAGAYAIQHGDIIERIEGSYNNVVGLPTERLRATLERLGLLGLGDG
jgi:Maf-like protein